MVFAAGCARTRVTRFEYGDIRLDVSGRIIEGKAVAMVDYKPGIYYSVDRANKQVLIDVRLASIGLKAPAILDIKWFDIAGPLIPATDIKNTTLRKSPPIAMGGLISIGGGIGTGRGGGRCPHGGTTGTCPDCSSGGGGNGINFPVFGVGGGKDSGKVTSVRATFDLDKSIDIEKSYLALDIQVGVAANKSLIVQPILLPIAVLRKYEPPAPPVKNTITALVRDDQTILLSGLLEGESDNDVKKKTPILGNIPLLGKLFKHNKPKTTRAELIIFVTPRIVLDAE